MVLVVDNTPSLNVSAVQWMDGSVRLLDQTRLPQAVEYVSISTVEAMIAAIQDMIVRGAPAIGISGAFGLVLGANAALIRWPHQRDVFVSELISDANRLAMARPTAVNLQWAINRLVAGIQENDFPTPQAIRDWLETEALAIFTEDLAMCHAIGRHGATVVPLGAGILTHCNAGALATAGYGTALGVVRAAFEADPSIQVYADETRPRLQGARLTTWELTQDGIPVTLLTDNMSAWLMKQGKVDIVVVGADRIAANGDSANKNRDVSAGVGCKSPSYSFLYCGAFIHY